MLRARTSVAASADDAPDTTLVTMTGDSAELQMAVGEGWVVACKTPCNQRLPRGAIFRIEGGDGEQDSNPFALATRGSRAHLDVHTGSFGARVGGIALTVVGGLSVVGGVLLLLVGGVTFGPGSRDAGLITGGAIALIGGLVAVPVGVVLTLSRTTVEQAESTTAIRAPEWIDHRVTPAPTNLGWTFTF